MRRPLRRLPHNVADGRAVDDDPFASTAAQHGWLNRLEAPVCVAAARAVLGAQTRRGRGQLQRRRVRDVKRREERLECRRGAGNNGKVHAHLGEEVGHGGAARWAGIDSRIEKDKTGDEARHDSGAGQR